MTKEQENKLKAHMAVNMALAALGIAACKTDKEAIDKTAEVLAMLSFGVGNGESNRTTKK